MSTRQVTTHLHHIVAVIPLVDPPGETTMYKLFVINKIRLTHFCIFLQLESAHNAMHPIVDALIYPKWRQVVPTYCGLLNHCMFFSHSLANFNWEKELRNSAGLCEQNSPRFIAGSQGMEWQHTGPRRANFESRNLCITKKEYKMPDATTLLAKTRFNMNMDGKIMTSVTIQMNIHKPKCTNNYWIPENLEWKYQLYGC